MGCITDCSPTLISRAFGDCNPDFMNGGFLAFAFMKCDKDFADVSGGVITDVARWEEMITDLDIVISRPILGSKGEVSTTSLRINSCQPEVVTGGSMPFAFEMYEADKTDFNHIKFWKDIQNKYSQLKFMAITCEGFVYGPFENKTWSITASEVRENTKETPAKISGTITVAEYILQVPVFVDGLVALI